MKNFRFPAGVILPLLATAAVLPAQSLIDTYETTARIGSGGVQTAPNTLAYQSYGLQITLGSWPTTSFSAADYPSSVTYSSPMGDVTPPIADAFHLEYGFAGTASYSTVTQLDPSGFFFTNFSYSVNGAFTSPFSVVATLHGGALDNLGLIVTADPALAPSAPLFTAESLGLLTSGNLINGGLATLSFSALSVPDGGRDAAFTLECYGPDASHFSVDLMAGATTATIDTSLLQPGGAYNLFLRENYTSADGVSYGTSTEVDFTTAAVPEPGTTVAFFGLAAGALVVWRRRHR